MANENFQIGDIVQARWHSLTEQLDVDDIGVVVGTGEILMVKFPSYFRPGAFLVDKDRIRLATEKEKKIYFLNRMKYGI